MNVRKVRENGTFSRGRPLASGTVSSTGHFSTQVDGDTVSATVFFVREKDDGSGKWEEFGITLTRVEWEYYDRFFNG